MRGKELGKPSKAKAKKAKPITSTGLSRATRGPGQQTMSERSKAVARAHKAKGDKRG